MEVIMKTRCIIHTMICDSRRLQYTGTRSGLTSDIRIGEEEAIQTLPATFQLISSNRSTVAEQGGYWRRFADRVENAEAHDSLVCYLVQNIWNISGDEEHNISTYRTKI
eukprot:gb/GEZJ01004284.1/.p1 GENE.gb/GEZJ01004284.1/~~gb/GEZJ01004284.1/.p1  ORF type:complete len:109 (-),score=4.85 gb/GEZJ01004284.1/:537-863(-)